MQDQHSVQSAVEDVAIVRRMINRAQKGEWSLPGDVSAIHAGLAYQGVIFASTVILFLIEVLTNRTFTTVMMLSRESTDIGTMGMGFAAGGLGALTVCLYFIVWRSARHEKEDFGEYVSRNFRYLRNCSFLSDLFCKSVALALLVLAQKPEWIAPLLTLFVADSLIAGRFFHISVRVAFMFGALAYVGAAALFLTHQTSLLWPLGLFACCTAISLANLIRLRQNLSDRAE